MIAQREQNDPQKVLEEMEKERQEMEDMFTIRAGEADKLREQDVLRKNAIAVHSSKKSIKYFNFKIKIKLLTLKTLASIFLGSEANPDVPLVSLIMCSFIDSSKKREKSPSWANNMIPIILHCTLVSVNLSEPGRVPAQ